MEGSDKKDLEEAVEKVLNEREEKKRQSMETPPTEKKDSTKEVSTPKKKNKMKHVDVAILIIVIVGLAIWSFWPSIAPEEVEPVIVYPANVVLDSFEDGLVLHITKVGGDGPIEIRLCDYVSVIFQLKNTGDEEATDVSCFIKCCDQNSTILFAQMFTFNDLGPNSTASDEYRVYVCDLDEVMYVTHGIEVQWSPHGTNTYVKLTEV